jgi:ABC-type antimicrobial peptide transport system permease subunit
MVLQLALASILLTSSVMLAKQSYDVVYQPLGYNFNNAYSLSWAYGDELWSEKLSGFDDYAGSEYQQLHNDLTQSLIQLLPGSKVVTIEAPLNSFLNIRRLMDPSIPEQFLFQTRDLSHNSFSAFNIEFLAGQAPTKAQIEANEQFIVIDKRMAETAFPDKPLEQILGQILIIGSDENAKSLPIIGIVQNTLSRVGALDKMVFPTIYATQKGNGQRLNISVLPPEGQSLDVSLISDEIESKFPWLVDLQVQSLSKRWDEQTLNQRICLAVILTLTCLTLFLAIIGVAGLTQMTTNQKRYEMAVRMATGAKQSLLLQLVFKDAMWMLVVGLSLGFVLSVLGYTEIEKSVSVMPEFDWQSMLLLDGGLITIVVLAVAVPAWRIIKADPMKSLREL